MVESAWPHKGRIILKFEGIDSIEEAEHLRQLHVLITRDERVPLPAHDYYVGDLAGCDVLLERMGEFKRVGKVTDVEPTEGVDLLHVTRGDGRLGEILIPFAQEICKRIDLEARTIFIDPPEDLLDLND
jgi:16S rRNA processing protein RimM